MKRFQGLTLGGQYLTADQIRRFPLEQRKVILAPHEQSALRFCQQWLLRKSDFIVRTSGSTGKPKEIAVCRSQMVASAEMTAEALGLEESDRALVCLSPDHVGGLMMLVRGLVLGLNLTITEPCRNPFEALTLRELRQTPFDFYSFVPLQIQSILSSRKRNLLNGAKAILVGGAHVSAVLKKQIQGIATPVYQTFGMTETLSHFALRKLNGSAASECYHALHGVKLGQDKRGCLTVKCPATGHKVITTNDLVELIDERNFKWLGRLDNVINTGGLKVHPETVEQAVKTTLHENAHLKLQEGAFFVGGLPDETYGQSVALIFESDPFPDDYFGKLRQALAARLKRHEVPKSILFTRAFERTPNGKIKRAATLRKLLSAQN